MSILYYEPENHYADWRVYLWLQPSIKDGLYEFYSVKQKRDTDVNEVYQCMVYLDGKQIRIWNGYGYHKSGSFEIDYECMSRDDRYRLKTMVNSHFKQNKKAIYIDEPFHYYQIKYKKEIQIRIELGLTHHFDGNIKENIKRLSMHEPWMIWERLTIPIEYEEILQQFQNSHKCFVSKYDISF